MSAWAERALARLVLRGATRVGRDARVRGLAHVENLGELVVGDGLRLAALPVRSHLVVAPGARLTLGHDVHVGHGVAIACHAAVTVGDGARLGPYVMVMDTDFHEAGDHASAGQARPVRIGAGARLGARVTVLRGSSVGDGARVLPGSVVSGDVPAGAVVGGVPARVLAGGGAPADRDVASAAEVLARTFGLASPPPPHAQPAQVPGWDSLGALKLLLALEEAFDVTLVEDELARVRCVGDLDALVARARAARASAA